MPTSFFPTSRLSLIAIVLLCGEIGQRTDRIPWVLLSLFPLAHNVECQDARTFVTDKRHRHWMESTDWTTQNAMVIYIYIYIGNKTKGMSRSSSNSLSRSSTFIKPLFALLLCYCCCMLMSFFTRTCNKEAQSEKGGEKIKEAGDYWNYFDKSYKLSRWLS